jgi:spore coat polysaccharide biosynthesis protein SpsF
VRSDALERAWREAKDQASREHVTWYIESHPDLFRTDGIVGEQDYSDLRWTVDTLADLELVRRVCGHFGKAHFGWREVIGLFEQQPELRAINEHIEQKSL